jgi:citrate lyase gamma subunit
MRVKEAIIGTLEFSDLRVKVTERQSRSRGRHSQQGHQTGYQANQSVVTRRSTNSTLARANRIENKGIRCMIQARVQTAVLRGCGTEELMEKL